MVFVEQFIVTFLDEKPRKRKAEVIHTLFYILFSVFNDLTSLMNTCTVVTGSKNYRKFWVYS